MSMLDEVKDLLEYFDSSNLQSLKYSNEKEKISLTKGKNFYNHTTKIKKERPTSIKNVAKEKIVNSNLVGLCYLGKEPGSTPFFKKGDKVSKGDVLCNIESMKIINEITSPMDGIFDKYLIHDEEVVDVGQPVVKLC